MDERNHYVLVVHGTGAAPTTDERPWFGRYQQPGNFCWELEERLQGTVLDGAVFRAVPENRPYWSWSGGNSHFDRIDAAESLVDEVRRVADADPDAVIHVVAHSHGGNVLLKAIERISNESTDGAPPLLGRLGKMVFLGTPFYRRRWKSSVAWLETFFNNTAIALSLAVVFGAILYAIITAARIGIWAFDDMDFLEAISPFRWNTAVIGGWASALLIIELVMFWIMRGALKTRRVDSNVYFNELIEFPSEPLHALVVHSGRFDEALLGLTVKPLLDTALNPVVSDVVDNAMGRTPKNPRWMEPVAGDPAQLSHGLRFLIKGSTFFLKALANRVLAWVLNPLNRFFKRRLRTSVLSVAELAALGLPASEVRDSTITVSELPQLQGVLNVKSRDVSRQFADWSIEDRRKAPAEETTETSNRSSRFEFLWDPDALEDAAQSSDAWARVEKDLDRLLEEYPTQEPDHFRQNLQRSTLTLEQRVNEIRGALPLEHSAYYENSAVIDAIAEFLIDER